MAMNKTSMKYLLKAIMLTVTLGFVSCRHKELCDEKIFAADVKVVFDWSKSPDAHVETMRVYLFPVDGGDALLYEFTDVQGGKITVPVGSYKALCINSDTDSLLYRNMNMYDTFEVYSPDGSMNAAAYAALNQDESPAERVGVSPDCFYTDRIQSLRLEITENEQVIRFVPENLVCRYWIEIRNVSNLQYVAAGWVTGGLSGMSVGRFLGENRLDAESVIIPFEMHSDGVSTLRTEFLTFGEYAVTKLHKVGVNVVMPDGNDKCYLYDVTEQIHNAPNPRDVHIILDGLPLPKPIVPGSGFHASVDEWENVEVDLPM